MSSINPLPNSLPTNRPASTHFDPSPNAVVSKAASEARITAVHDDNTIRSTATHSVATMPNRMNDPIVNGLIVFFATMPQSPTQDHPFKEHN